jgi:hypothetical protein
MSSEHLALRAFTSDELAEELKSRPPAERRVPGMTVEDAMDLLEEAGAPEGALAVLAEWRTLPVADERRLDAWLALCGLASWNANASAGIE